MTELTGLYDLFAMYTERKIDVFELQNWISTVCFESKADAKKLEEFDNELERIAYCFPVEKHYQMVVNTIKKYYPC